MKLVNPPVKRIDLHFPLGLEVTARNEPAVRMYRRLGFRCTRTTYRAVPTAAGIGAGTPAGGID